MCGSVSGNGNIDGRWSIVTCWISKEVDGAHQEGLVNNLMILFHCLILHSKGFGMLLKTSIF